MLKFYYVFNCFSKQYLFFEIFEVSFNFQLIWTNPRKNFRESNPSRFLNNTEFCYKQI